MVSQSLQEKNIDIVLRSESHFTNVSYISLPGYYAIHANHPDNTAQAKAAIFVKSSLAFNLLPSYLTLHIQFCAMCLVLNNILFSIATTYRPLRHSISTNQFSEFLFTLGWYYILNDERKRQHSTTNHIQFSCNYNSTSKPYLLVNVSPQNA